jgi:geranylgeranyl diphosphate synthase type I
MPQELSVYLDAIEDALRRDLAVREPLVAPLYQMMHYHLGWLDASFAPVNAARGKRLRPLLCLLACEAVGGDWRRALPAASAIELIHNFSLLHDDIEDRSETRRHRSTVWSLWGLAQGLNTGDAMWALARLAALRLTEQGFTAELVLRVVKLLDETCLELCTGQYLDLAFEAAPSVSLAAYERMITGKTAALLAAALACGALLGGAGEEVVAAYGASGRELGLTFQIVDDILGIWGDPATTGKSAADDILTKKKTLPVLYAFAWEAERGYGDLAALYARPVLGEQDLPAVLALLERAGAQAYARQRAQEHLHKTLEHLCSTGIVHPAQEALRELALSLVERAS